MERRGRECNEFRIPLIGEWIAYKFCKAFEEKRLARLQFHLHHSKPRNPSTQLLSAAEVMRFLAGLKLVLNCHNISLRKFPNSVLFADLKTKQNSESKTQTLSKFLAFLCTDINLLVYIALSCSHFKTSSFDW